MYQTLDPWGQGLPDASTIQLQLDLQPCVKSPAPALTQQPHTPQGHSINTDILPFCVVSRIVEGVDHILRYVAMGSVYSYICQKDLYDQGKDFL